MKNLTKKNDKHSFLDYTCHKFLYPTNLPRYTGNFHSTKGVLNMIKTTLDINKSTLDESLYYFYLTKVSHLKKGVFNYD